MLARDPHSINTNYRVRIAGEQNVAIDSPIDKLWSVGPNMFHAKTCQ